MTDETSDPPYRAGLPAVVPGASARPAGAERRALSAFAAHLFSQTGRRRGLKGGPPVLEAATSAYLDAEWSGPADRRRARGKTTRTDV